MFAVSLDVKTDDNNTLTPLGDMEMALESSSLFLDVTNIEVISGNENISLANNYLVLEKIKYDIDGLQPGTESFVSKVVSGISKVFDTIISFLKNLASKIFKLFKRVWDFIMGLFKKDSKGGGSGGGSGTRKKIEDRKKEVEEEIKDLKEKSDKEGMDRVKDDVISYEKKYRNRIADALANHPTFFFMPRDSKDVITSKDIYNYTKVLLDSYDRITSGIYAELLSSGVNPFMTIIDSNDGNIMKILEDIILAYETINKKVESIHSDSRLYEVYSNDFNKILNGLSSDLTEFINEASDVSDGLTVGELLYDNKSILIPDELKEVFRNEDSGLSEEFKVHRTLVGVTNKKMIYVKTIYDNKFETDISSRIQKIQDDLSSSDDTTTLDNFVLNVLILIKSVLSSYKIEIKSYDVTSGAPDIDTLRKLTDEITVTDRQAEANIDVVMKLYENITRKSLNEASKVKIILSRAESNVEDLTSNINKMKKRMKDFTKDPSNIERGNVVTILNDMAAISSIVSKNTINPIKEFLGVNKEGSLVLVGMLKTNYSDMYTENTKSNYSTLNIMINLYGLERMQEFGLMNH